MIGILNLIWIIPLSICIGMLSACFIFGATQKEKEYDAYVRGFEEGKRIGVNIK